MIWDFFMTMNLCLLPVNFDVFVRILFYHKIRNSQTLFLDWLPTKAEDPSLLYYLLIIGGLEFRTVLLLHSLSPKAIGTSLPFYLLIDGYIPFPILFGHKWIVFNRSRYPLLQRASKDKLNPYFKAPITEKIIWSWLKNLVNKNVSWHFKN